MIISTAKKAKMKSSKAWREAGPQRRGLRGSAARPSPRGGHGQQAAHPGPTSRMLQRSDWHSTSSQGRNMPRVTQLSMMTSMLTCSNHVRRAEELRVNAGG